MILFLYIGHFLLIPLTDIHEILSSDESISERTSRRLLLLLSVKFLLLRWLIDLIVFIVHMHKSSGDLTDELRTLATLLLAIVRAKFRVRYVQMPFCSSDCHVHQSTYSTRQTQRWEMKAKTDVLLPRHSCRRNSTEIDFELEDSIVLIFGTQKKVNSPNPAMNTYWNSKPLAPCTVIICTRSGSSVVSSFPSCVLVVS